MPADTPNETLFDAHAPNSAAKNQEVREGASALNWNGIKLMQTGAQSLAVPTDKLVGARTLTVQAALTVQENQQQEQARFSQLLSIHPVSPMSVQQELVPRG